jgi:MFS family permease
LLVIGLAVSVVGQGLMAVVPSYEYLLPLIALVSASQAGYLTLGLALVGDLLEQRTEGRGRWMGFYRGMGSLGFGLTAFVAGTVADRFSLRAPFGIHAFIVLISLLLTLAIDEPAPRTESASRDEAGAWRVLVVSVRDAVKAMGSQFAALSRASGVRSSESDRAPGRLPLTPLLVSAFLWFVAYGAVSGVWSNYLVSELNYTQEFVGRLYSIAALTEVPFMVFVGWLSDRTGRLPMLSLGFLTWTLVFAGYAFIPIMPWIVVIQLVRGFAYSAFTATTMTYAAEVRSKSERGQASGLYNASSGLGSILGGPLGGAQAQYTSSRAMIVTNAVLMLAGGVYVAVVAVRQKMFARSKAL